MALSRYSTLDERLYDRLVRDESGCLIWQGAKNRKGYGVVNFEGKKWMVHRLVYTLKVGPIPDGLELDHTCRVHDCAEPDHLNPVTGPENAARYKDFRNGVCLRGHKKKDRMGSKKGQWCPECQKEQDYR